jgi:hypothetical protein
MYVGRGERERERERTSEADMRVKQNREGGEIPDTLQYSFCSFFYFFYLAQQPPQWA